jgi:hypothetical protein
MGVDRPELGAEVTHRQNLVGQSELDYPYCTPKCGF